MGRTFQRGTRTGAAGALTVALVMIGAAAAAQAQTVAAPGDAAPLRARMAPLWAASSKIMPKDQADLDVWFDRKDWQSLTQRLRAASTADQIFLDMNWEQTAVFNGAGFAVSYAYMYDLWRLGSALPASRGDDMRQAALILYIYNLLLVKIDGLTCADPSAPEHRGQQLVMQNRDLLKFFASQSKADRAKWGSVALALETATAALRGRDDVLCSGGLDQISQGLKAEGDKPLPEAPSAPSVVGRTYLVPTPPGYQPGFLSAEQAGPKVAAARQAAPAFLNRYLMLSDPAPVSPAN
jgi:hypothetical protein